MTVTKVKQWLASLTQGQTKPNSLYQMIGGEAVVRALCERFYDIMDSDDKAIELRDIHSEDLTETRQKFFEFMSGWLGGPPLFEQKYGHPRLRARHLHVKVDQMMISQWLYCMNKALTETVDHVTARQAISQNLTPLAHHMKNV